MFFMTKQPKFVSEQLENHDYYPGIDNYHTNGNGKGNFPVIQEFGFQPVYSIPLIDKVDFLIKHTITPASCPEVAIIFETEDYECMDAVKWYKYLEGSKVEGSLRIEAGSDREKEYITEKIGQADVRKKINTPNIKIKDQLYDIKKSSQMMLGLPDFWNSLSPYFPGDDRDILQMCVTAEYAEILQNYSKISQISNDVENVMKYFRMGVEALAKKIYG